MPQNSEENEEINEENEAPSKEKQVEEARKFLEKESQRGVCYMSKIPSGMNVAQLKEYFKRYRVGRVYLEPLKKPPSEAEKGKSALSKKETGRIYKEGWIEFDDKRIAKYVSMTFNGKQFPFIPCIGILSMFLACVLCGLLPRNILEKGETKGSRHYNDTWNMKYLKGFKWDYLTEKQKQDKKEHRDRMLSSIKLARKKQEFFLERMDESKKKKAAVKRIQTKEMMGKAKQGESEEESEQGFDVNDYEPAALLGKRSK